MNALLFSTDVSSVFEKCPICDNTYFVLSERVKCPTCEDKENVFGNKMLTSSHIGEGEIGSGSKSKQAETHLRDRKGNVDDDETPEDDDHQKHLLYLYRILLSQSSYCKHKCGVYTTLTELKDHESVCFKRPLPAKCHMIGCLWNGTNQELIHHVIGHHPNNVIVYSERRTDEILITSKESVKLLLLFEQNYPANEMFWVRLYQEKNQSYFMIQHLGACGIDVASSNAPTLYSVKANDISIQASINRGHLAGSIADNEFIKANGTNISVLDSDEYYLSMYTKETRNERLSNCTIMRELECKVCAMIMSRPIRMCVTGHSICEKCIKNLKECPLCKESYQQTRNYALEAIADKIETCCPNRDNGCLEYFVASKMEEHIKYCMFRQIHCLGEECTWHGAVKNLFEHCEQNHDNIISNWEINSVKCTSDMGEYISIMFAFDNMFTVEYEISEDNITFVVRHLTYNKDTNFEFEIKVLNNQNKIVWSMSLPCPKVSLDFDESDVFCAVPSSLYEPLKDEKDEIQFVVTVFKSLNNNEVKVSFVK